MRQTASKRATAWSSTWAIAWALGIAIPTMGGCGKEEAIVIPLGLSATFDYVVPARFKIPDPLSPEGQYEVYTDGPLHPSAWPVAFDACASTGSIVQYHWGVDGSAAGSTTDCDAFVYDFPAEGTYTVSLLVEDRDGDEDSHTVDILVKDWLIFGVGDSYGSGEGNPDVRVSFTAASAVAAYEEADASQAPTLAPASAQWQNRRCHRSAHSGQVRAAQLLEDADPHSSVTFVHLACSGARVHRGLLEEYLGVEEDGPPFPPQMDRVAELAAGHEIDALVVSIGGNDVNFANIIEACIQGEDCHESPVSLDPALLEQAAVICALSASFEAECLDYFDSLLLVPEALDARMIFDVHSITEDVCDLDVCDLDMCDEDVCRIDIRQDGNDDLPDNYRDLAAEIVDGLGMDPTRVYLTEIPDVTRNEFGQYCGWDTALTVSAKLLELPGVTQAEWGWASTYVTFELGATMQAAAEEHDWKLVTGIAARFRRHGYCSIFGWLMRLHDTFLIQGDEFGVLHPNVAGHDVYAAAIANAIDP